MKTSRAFTLIELMAVVIIIGVLSLMTMPIFRDMIDASKEKAAVSNAHSISKQITLLFQEESLGGANTAISFEYNDGVETSTVDGASLDYRGKKPLFGDISINDSGEVSMFYWDGKYCLTKEANSSVITSYIGATYADCILTVDETEPIVVLGSNTVTTTSITIIADVTDEESIITAYYFSKDGGTTWTSAQGTNSYTYYNLDYNTPYNIKVKADNSAGLTGLSATTVVTTASVDIPQISQTPSGWSTSKTVTFSFPNRNGSLTYYYSVNGGTDFTLLDPALTKDELISANALMVAQIRNGATVVESNSLNLTQIDTTAPAITIVTNGGSVEGTARSVVNATDAGSGIGTLEYAWTTSATFPSSGFTTFTSGANLSNSNAGTYYLHIRATDAIGNTSTQTSGAFVITPKTYYVVAKGVNKPALPSGMVPVKWNGSAWIDTTVDDPAWYDYSSKNWANARTNGTDTSSIFVWIPRFAYQIPNNYHTSTFNSINIKFLMDKTDTTYDGTPIAQTPTYSGSSQTNYVSHPAFTFGVDELTGIWVAKFEPSGSGSDVSIVPNAAQYSNISVNDAFNVALNMASNTSRYGWSNTEVDTHMMNSYEWGAVSYLASSTYGKNSEVWLNNSTNITGCVGSNATDRKNNSCENAYQTTTGQNGSTSGTVYGIYDMPGGFHEYLCSYYNNGNSALTTYGNACVTASSKYKTVLPYGTDDTSAAAIIASQPVFGTALYETRTNNMGTYEGWNQDRSLLPYGANPFIIMGDYNDQQGGTGLFSIYASSGASASNATFRPVIALPND